MRNKGIPVAALVVVASAVIGGVFGRLAATEDRVMTRYRIYVAALASVERDYAEVVDPAQVIYGSIDGMLRTLDPHSTFFTPKDFAQMQERQKGNYFGIGITIQQQLNGDVMVTSLFEGTPAYRAGIRRNDVIAKVGGESAKGWTTEDVVKRIKGPNKGSTVAISIRRPGVDSLIDLIVPRDEIHIVSVRTAFMIAPGTGYVRLQDFIDTTETELKAALKKLSAAGMSRLILDLRENPGGELNQAIAVSNTFLKRGQPIVSMKGRIPQSVGNFVAEQDGEYTSVPLVVLVNRDSASASEIVSGAMQDHDRGLIVGETTFGKALVQSVFLIQEQAGLALTTAYYRTPSGRIIQRPWDATFDEYETYGLRDRTLRPHPESELRYTDAGRKVLCGGGGIEPDHFLPGPVDGFNPSMFSRAIYARGAFINFAGRFTKEGDTSPAASKSAARCKVARGWQVTDAMVADFKQDLVALRYKVDEAAFTADVPFYKAMIRFEVDVDLFGVEEARRNLSSIDPQAQKALGYFDEAQKLLEMKKGK